MAVLAEIVELLSVSAPPLKMPPPKKAVLPESVELTRVSVSDSEW